MTLARSTDHSTSGFSLVELMIAMLLGVVVIAGIIALFVGNSRASALVSGQARLQENARYAFDFISRGARQAGYFGCAPQPQNIVKGLVGNWSDMPEFDITRIVDGHEGNRGGTWTPSLSGLPGGSPGNLNNDPGGAIDVDLIVPGSDVLVFRNMRQPGQRLLQPLLPTGNAVVAAAAIGSNFDVGDIVMVADCEQGAVFRVTGINSDASQATLLRESGVGVFDNAANIDSPAGLVPARLSFFDRGYGAEATVGAVESTYFFVAPSLHEDRFGNNPLALWQKVGSVGPVELVQGVEDLQVLYGIDTTLSDGISNPNQYVPFSAVPSDVGQIVAIRATLRVNSIDAVSEDGRRLVRTFSKTILLRNSRPEV